MKKPKLPKKWDTASTKRYNNRWWMWFNSLTKEQQKQELKNQHL